MLLAHCGRLARGAAVAGSLPLLASPYSVFAWGRNLEGQCGVEMGPLVPTATKISDLCSHEVVALAAGQKHSAAVLRSGDVLTWGCGKSGKLGQGDAVQNNTPGRVESLVGRTEVWQAALGESHSLFLDGRGEVWSCGENKEGQCGLGTPLAVLAQQRRAEFDLSINQPILSNNSSLSARKQQLDAAQSGDLPSSSSSSAASSSSSSPSLSRASIPLMPFIDVGSRQRELDIADSLLKLSQDAMQPTNPAEALVGKVSASMAGLDAEHGPVSGPGVMPGQHASPVRLGRDLRSLFWEVDASEEQGIEGQHVVQLTASRFFSAALTRSGEIFTFGGGFNGELGSSWSWSSSARRLSPQLEAELANEGGAVRVEAGGQFCVALTREGGIYIWGKHPGVAGSSTSAASSAAASSSNSETVMRNGGEAKHDGNVAGYVRISGLPEDAGRITHIAAGANHALMSDGRRVWCVGRLGSNRNEPSASCDAPEQVWEAEAGTAGVKQLAAGSTASALVTEDGELWTWGSVLDRAKADALAANAPEHVAVAPQHMDWSWAGWGGSTPARVPGLPPVRAVALGQSHVLVLADD